MQDPSQVMACLLVLLLVQQLVIQELLLLLLDPKHLDHYQLQRGCASHLLLLLLLPPGCRCHHYCVGQWQPMVEHVVLVLLL